MSSPHAPSQTFQPLTCCCGPFAKTQAKARMKRACRRAQQAEETHAAVAKTRTSSRSARHSHHFTILEAPLCEAAAIVPLHHAIQLDRVQFVAVPDCVHAQLATLVGRCVEERKELILPAFKLESDRHGSAPSSVSRVHTSGGLPYAAEGTGTYNKPTMHQPGEATRAHGYCWHFLVSGLATRRHLCKAWAALPGWCIN